MLIGYCLVSSSTAHLIQFQLKHIAAVYHLGKVRSIHLFQGLGKKFVIATATLPKAVSEGGLHLHRGCKKNVLHPPHPPSPPPT